MNEVVRKAQNGDKYAMNQLYSSYAKAMLNTSYRIVNNVEDAEDVIQDSFVKAFSSLHQFQFRSTFGAWIKRIVVNKSIDHLRKKKNGLTITQNDNELKTVVDEEVFLPNVENKEILLDQVYKAIHLLPNGYRTVLSLYLLEGYDHEEISQILAIKYNTSLSQYSRARKKLISIINENN